MKKITVDKNEGIAEIIDRMLAVDDAEVLFVIPKNSMLAKSASSFRLLKREADTAEKSISIESIDEDILDLAKESNIPSGHAFLRRSPAPGDVSDIVIKDGSEEEEEVSRRSGKKMKPVKLTVRDGESAYGNHSDGNESDEEDETVDDTDLEEDDSAPREEMGEAGDGAGNFWGGNRFFKEMPNMLHRGNTDDDTEGSRSISGKTVGWVVGAIIVVIGVFYGVTAFLGHAQVTIDFTQTPWSYQNNFVADKGVSAINAGTSVIPAQIFTSTKNITQLFPATGASANVASKAQGTITIYNNYSAESQDLVATTRFQAPDGKIFRLATSVTIPGAKVSGATITPSSVTAPIIADQGGPDYNVGPISKLTIPGFAKDAKKFAGFYGEITGQTTGGFIGNKPIPTLGDIANAKTKTTAILQADLQDGLTASYPNNFKILDGATNIAVPKLTVSTSTDANGNFSVFGEATLVAIGFDEGAFKDYLLSMAAANGVRSTFKSVTLNYSNVKANFTTGQVGFSLDAQGVVEPAFSSDDFAASLAGKSISSARDAIQALPQLANGKISVWPVWLWSMPSDIKKIQVTAN